MVQVRFLDLNLETPRLDASSFKFRVRLNTVQCVVAVEGPHEQPSSP